jgi:hypothetical protein
MNCIKKEFAHWKSITFYLKRKEGKFKIYVAP